MLERVKSLDKTLHREGSESVSGSEGVIVGLAERESGQWDKRGPLMGDGTHDADGGEAGRLSDDVGGQRDDVVGGGGGRESEKERLDAGRRATGGGGSGGGEHGVEENEDAAMRCVCADSRDEVSPGVRVKNQVEGDVNNSGVWDERVE